MTDINDVRHTSTLAKFEEAVRRSSPETETLADKIERLASEATAAPWKSRGMGGHSVLIAKDAPAHNRRVPVAYGYRPEDGYSVGLPFSYEENGERHTRGDFVEFSHRDAELIATLINACPTIIAALRSGGFAQTPAQEALLAAREYIGEDNNPRSNRVLQKIALALSSTDREGK